MARVAMLAAAIGCSGSPAPKDVSRAEAVERAATTSTIEKPDTIRWPRDQTKHQLSSIDSLQLNVPSCGNATVPFTVDSVGPLRPGQTLSDVISRCAQVLPLWDWGNEGIPTPVLLTRFGAMTVRISLRDTLPSSQVASLLSSDASARTMQGVGPGSTVAELQRAYGRLRYQEGECVVYATLPSMRGISFRLDLLEKFECGTLEGDGGKQWSAPVGARVTEVFVYQR